jgi:hypothetical protein
MASIRAIYGIVLVARPRVPRRTPEEEPAPVERPPRRPRRRGRAAAEEASQAVSEELQDRHQQLEVRRQDLLEQARFGAQSGQTVEIFQDNFVSQRCKPRVGVPHMGGFVGSPLSQTEVIRSRQ